MNELALPKVKASRLSAKLSDCWDNSRTTLLCNK